MIKIPPARATDYQRIEATLSGLGSLDELRTFYEGFIERYAKLDQRFLFTESFDPQFVRDQLDEVWALRDRELFAIPLGIKDVFNTRVLPTSMGSDIWRGFKAGNNARVVDEVADRGGVVFSKTTTAEFAVHYIQAGRTLNPHNTGHITGTSSSGSAVAVACGALPICFGTQTAGSIVRPASFCGVFGFKPSFGAYDRTGTLKTTDTLDTIGLLGSDIYGLRKTFLATFQKDPQYPVAKNYFTHLRLHRQRERLRIGVITDQFAGYERYDEGVKRDFAEAVRHLGDSGMSVSAPPAISFINEIHPLHEKIYCKALSYYFHQEVAHEGRMSEVMRDMIARGSQVSTQEYVDALRWQPDYRARFDAVLSNYDFLLTPSTATPAPPLGAAEIDDTCLIWTFLGYPVLSIPAFYSTQYGLPVGLQIVAPKFGDLALLDFGEQILDLLRQVAP